MAHASRPMWRTDIEGLRGVAVLLVVLYHAGVPAFSGGFTGVDVFFALSGYLITGILVREVDTSGTIRLGPFYARRVRRLLPASFVLVLAVAAFSFVFSSPLLQPRHAGTALWTSVYLANVTLSRASAGYFAPTAETNPFLHMWSLAVEEQFYLLWPVLILAGYAGALALARRDGPADIRRRRLVWVVGAVAAASFVASEVLVRTGGASLAFYLAPLRAWEFALGGLGALTPLAFRQKLTAETSSGRALPAWAGDVSGWLGLVAIAAAGTLYTAGTPFPGAAALLPVVGTVLVLRAGGGLGASAVARALSVRPLRELGRLSYSWYLWHWPVLVLAAELYGDLPLGARLALVAASLGLAELSYRLVEDPVRRTSWLAATPARGLGLLVVLTLVGLGAMFGWQTAARRARSAPDVAAEAAARVDRFDAQPWACHDDFAVSTPTGCSEGPAGGPTVVLYGDSHAGHWAPAVRDVFRPAGWRVVYLTKAGCPPVDVLYFNRRLGREYVECAQWRRNAEARIRRIAPQLVVSSAFYGHYPFRAAEWQAGATRTLRSLSAAAGRVVWLHDTPTPPHDVPECLARVVRQRRLGVSLGHPCDFALDGTLDVEARQAVSAAVAVVAGAVELDLTSEVCPAGQCRARLGGRIVFSDDDHLTATFGRSLAPALGRGLETALDLDLAVAR